jgi:hypothetical protein
LPRLYFTKAALETRIGRLYIRYKGKHLVGPNPLHPQRGFMSIKANVYDFFAYTIPGGFILLTTLYALTIFGVLQIDFFSLAPSTAQIIIIIGLSYILGLLLEPIARLWYRLFKPKGYAELALIEFKKSHPLIHVNFEASDWNILFAYLKRQNLDIASDIERVNASSVMLRNISFGFMVLAVAELVNFYMLFLPLHLFFSIVLLVFSIIAGKESDKFAQWFFLAIFENIASQALQISDLVKCAQEA